MKPQTPATRFQAPPAPETGQRVALELLIEEEAGVFYADVNGRPVAKSTSLPRLLRHLAEIL